MNPQEALDCPRWQWTGGRHFEVERGIPASCIEELRNRGHEIDIVDDMTVLRTGTDDMPESGRRADGGDRAKS